MKLHVFSIRDAQLSTYQAPFYAKTKGEARRIFADAVKNPDANNILNKHPEDFSMWHLGLYDDETGFFDQSGANGVELMAQAKDVKEDN